jgi:replicative DNA helicase
VFKSLDQYFNGGLEPSREYIIAGTSGSGKSTLMTNMIARSALAKNGPPRVNVKDLENKTDIKHVYVYVTMENTADESLMRIYEDVMDMTEDDLLLKLKSGEIDSDIMKEHINAKMRPHGATIVMKYFPALTISPVDIMGVLDEVISTYGKGTIAALYVDYLDLLTTDSPYDLYRMELAKIVLTLKSMAISYNIPVVTATQLNRSAYRVENPKDLGADQLGESIKKVEHSDMVLVLHKIIKNGVDVVIGKIAKFRSGRSGYAIESRVEFEKYKFGEFTLVKNEDKKDNVKPRSGDSMSLDGCSTMMANGIPLTVPEKRKNTFGVGPDDGVGI